MNSFSIADELDQAVSNVLAGVETAGVNTDLEIGELIGIAVELSDLPEPLFKAQLKAHLTGVVAIEPCGAGACPGSGDFQTSASRDGQLEVFPSLFRAITDGYPLHQRN